MRTIKKMTPANISVFFVQMSKILTWIYTLPHVKTMIFNSQEMPKDYPIFWLEGWDIAQDIQYVVKKKFNHR